MWGSGISKESFISLLNVVNEVFLGHVILVKYLGVSKRKCYPCYLVYPVHFSRGHFSFSSVVLSNLNVKNDPKLITKIHSFLSKMYTSLSQVIGRHPHRNKRISLHFSVLIFSAFYCFIFYIGIGP